MKKTLVVGDIHGCYDELMDLLSLAGIGIEDEIWALGDIIDRGPKNKDVLDFFYLNDNAFSIEGNHERKHTNHILNKSFISLSQKIVKEELGRKYEHRCCVFETFPLYQELKEAYLIHGYVEPGKCLEEQNEKVLLGTISGAKRIKEVCRDEQWYELARLDKPIIVGHQNYNADHSPLIFRDKVFGIDTDCCCGGKLTGILLPDFKIFQVDSKEGNYWEKISSGSRKKRLDKPGIPSV